MWLNAVCCHRQDWKCSFSAHCLFCILRFCWLHRRPLVYDLIWTYCCVIFQAIVSMGEWPLLFLCCHSKLHLNLDPSVVSGPRYWRHGIETLSTLLAHYESSAMDSTHKEPTMRSSGAFLLLLVTTSYWTNNQIAYNLRHHEAQVTSL